MFDIGFIEMLVVAIVALLVLGPERLPVAVRTAGLAIGRIKRGFADVRSQVEREIGADEIRRQLHNERIMSDLAKSDKQGKQDDKPGKPDPGAPVADPKVTGSDVKPGSNASVTSTEQTAPAADAVASTDAPAPPVTDITDDSPTRPDER
ncbi:Sec-independent protein translocase protein TatB [Pseudomonas saliphila]|uniref:Sec-independent protein translocase protein TatB n=1 Tax=Pseudomonas saliphila TaxID=2586906 RepID=UPI00123860E7|nr:Sec-independent protein translocase protein TatB [Pseudomonas saliphila]